MISWFSRNWFLAGLILTATFAFLLPQAGAEGGMFRTEVTTKLAVAGIFFIRGTLLPMAELGRSIRSWRLHLWVHACIFLLFPLGVFFLFEGIGNWWEIDPNLRVGFIFLATLPTTISTAVVFTSMAGGNTAGSVFNATVSNCLGVLIVPLWMAWILERETIPLSVGMTVFQVVLLVVVPLVIGQAVKPFLWEFSARHRKGLEVASSLIILFVIYAAFSNSVMGGIWREQSWRMLSGCFGLSLLIFLTATVAAVLIGCVAKLAREDRICLLFCAPQKTLAGGVTLANVMFADNPALGLILLPVLFYHILQLFAGGFLIAHWRR